MATALAHPTDPASTPTDLATAFATPSPTATTATTSTSHATLATGLPTGPQPADCPVSPTPPTDPPPPTPIRADLTPAAQQRLLLQDRAWELYCQGERSPAIAAALGVPARTIRDWLRAIRTQLAPMSHEQRAQQQALAVERQRSVLAAAWDGFHSDRERQEQLYAGAYDHLTLRTTRPAPAPASARPAPAAKTAKNASTPPPTAPTTTPTASASPAEPAPLLLDERYARPRDTTHPVQYLRLALTANREMARLLGLYDRHSFPLTATPEAPTPPTPASAAAATPAESAAAAKTAKTSLPAAPDSASPRASSARDYPRPSGREAATIPALALRTPYAPDFPTGHSCPPPVLRPLKAESATPASAAKMAKITTKSAAKTAKKSPALTHRQRRVAAPPRRSKEGRRLHASARPLRQ